MMINNLQLIKGIIKIINTDNDSLFHPKKKEELLSFYQNEPHTRYILFIQYMNIIIDRNIKEKKKYYNIFFSLAEFSENKYFKLETYDMIFEFLEFYTKYKILFDNYMDSLTRYKSSENPPPDCPNNNVCLENEQLGLEDPILQQYYTCYDSNKMIKLSDSYCYDRNSIETYIDEKYIDNDEIEPNVSSPITKAPFTLKDFKLIYGDTYKAPYMLYRVYYNYYYLEYEKYKKSYEKMSNFNKFTKRFKVWLKFYGKKEYTKDDVNQYIKILSDKEKQNESDFKKTNIYNYIYEYSDIDTLRSRYIDEVEKIIPFLTTKIAQLYFELSKCVINLLPKDLYGNKSQIYEYMWTLFEKEPDLFDNPVKKKEILDKINIDIVNIDNLNKITDLMINSLVLTEIISKKENIIDNLSLKLGLIEKRKKALLELFNKVAIFCEKKTITKDTFSNIYKFIKVFIKHKALILQDI
jgi:hypothetical protein